MKNEIPETVKAEIEALYKEINELRQHIMTLTEVVQGINGVLGDLNKAVNNK